MQDSLLARAPLLDDLLPATLSRRLESMAKRVHYDNAHLIQARGDTKIGLSIVREGAVRVGNLGRDGSYLNTSILSVGQSYGEFTLFAGLPCTHEAIALGDTVVDEIGRIRFMALFKTEPLLAKAMLTISLVRSHALLEFVDDMRRLPLLVHVGKVIYSAAYKTSILNIRQEELAFTFGVSRVSIGKVLKKLAAMGLVSLGYGKIHIIDGDKFEAWLKEKSLVDSLAPRLL